MFKHFLNLIFFILVKSLQEDEKILFVFQMQSNGARSPNNGVNNGIDLFKENWYGNNELSDIGRRQLYLLGVKVRNRYKKLLPEYYNPHDIYIKSTDNNMTIESIYSFLQGLFPSGYGQNISENIINKTEIIYPPNIKYKNNFDEIIKNYNLENSSMALPYGISIEPIHIFYRPNNDFQLIKGNICEGFNEEYEKLKKRKEIKEFVDNLNDEIKQIFMKLENSENIDFLYDYNNLYKYIDNFKCDNFDIRNFTFLKNEIIKSNNSEEILNNLNKSSYEFLFDDYMINYNSTEMFIVDSSQTMESIINWMNLAINNNQNYIKYVIYSTDDSSIGTLDGFLYSLFKKEEKIEYPNFAECRFLELYLDKNNELKIRYMKGNNETKLDIKYENFKNEVEKNIWTKEKINNFCKFEKDNEKENEKESTDEIIKKKEINKIGAGFMVILSIIDGFLLALLILVCVQKNLKKKKNNIETTQ